MNLNEKVALGLACFFAGTVVGFLIAPIKKKICFENNDKNNYVDNENKEGKEKSEEDITNEIDKVIEEVTKDMIRN